jgi:hypothetical protein
MKAEELLKRVILRAKTGMANYTKINAIVSKIL